MTEICDPDSANKIKIRPAIDIIDVDTLGLSYFQAQAEGRCLGDMV
jgi:hypothetical protein